MSQGSLVLPTSGTVSGLLMTQKANAAHDALATENAGGSAPANAGVAGTSTEPYLKWADTTNAVVKQRNVADTAWLLRDTLREQFVIPRATNTALGIADYKGLYRATASFTQTFNAVATLPDGWYADYKVESGATVTFDPNGAETVDGVTTKAIVGPASGRIWSDGTALYTTGFPATSTTTGAGKNYAINGSFAVNQLVTPTTADNSYPIDGWRLLLGAANAATFVQDTSDVPGGAGFAAKLIVGSGNNNKFGIFCPIENKDILDLRGKVASLLVPLKATAGLTDGTGKIRVGILQFTGTADAISGDPISAWNAEGTNPTLAANWSYANTPAAIAVTTAWVDYAVANASISASATNLALFIWSDDAANTQTTDILQVGGYVTLASGATAPSASVAPFDVEYRKCLRYLTKTFPYATAPAQNAGTAGAISYIVQVGTTVPSAIPWYLPEVMRVAPTVTFFNPSAANANWRSITRTADNGASSIPVTQGERMVVVKDAGNGSQALGDLVAIHALADARL